MSTPSPSHFPITTSLRRNGRASIERRRPLSTSLEISGPATTAALSASTPLYMKVTPIKSCEVISATCAAGRVTPLLFVTVVILLKPQAEKPTRIGGIIFPRPPAAGGSGPPASGGAARPHTPDHPCQRSPPRAPALALA